MAGLRQFLDRFFADGPVPFEAFMREALGHPEFGYYAAHVEDIGVRGDFATSPTMAPVLGAAVAGWIEAEAASFAGADRMHLVEAGPGDGSLLRHVLGALPARLRRRLVLHLVEVSPALATAQGATLSRFRRRLTWHPGMAEAMDHIHRTAPGPVLVYANEWADAFPVRVFRKGPPDAGRAAVRELHLAFGDGRLAETWLPAPDPPASTVFARDFPPGQRLEVHHAFHRDLATWVPRLAAGSLLLIDYGGPVESLYDRRPHGTLRAYWRHQRFEGPDIYARFGRQDLTADVNFSDLMTWGRELGLETVACTTQRAFLAPHIRSDTDVDAYLTDPLGPGHAFRVLHQRKRTGRDDGIRNGPAPGP